MQDMISNGSDVQIASFGLSASNGGYGTVMTPEGGRARLPANADEFGLNLPLPWEEKRGTGASTACIVKFYDDLIDKARICQTIEVVGILCVQPQAATFNETPLYEDDDMT